MAEALTFGSLFSGIGGLDLGLEWAGMECKWQVEIEPYCLRVLEEHWPAVRRYKDVREVTKLEPVDLICGGFPCQDISAASSTATGIVGKRSGLWSEFKRLVGDIQPRFALVENVPTLRTRGLTLVLQDLWEVGYDAEWHCVPASAFGAYHERDRVWVIGYPAGWWDWQCIVPNADIDSEGRRTAGCIRPGGTPETGSQRQFTGSGLLRPIADPDGEPLVGAAIARGERHAWTVEPGVVRMVHGVPDRVDRIKALGNAVVPQVAEWIGRQIVKAAGRQDG